MATNDDTAARITKILVEHLGVTPDQVQPETLLVPDHDDMGRQLESHRPHLGCDSLDVVEIVMALEEEFNVAIPDDAAEPLQKGTVKDLTELVDRRLAEAA